VSADKLKPAIVGLSKVVLGIKGRGDKEVALKFKAEYCDVDGDYKKQREIISERWLRSPKTSFVYSIEL